MSKHKVVTDPETGAMVGTVIDYGERRMEINTAEMGNPIPVFPLSSQFRIKPAIEQVEVMVVDPRVKDYELPGAHTVESAGYDLRAFPTWLNPATGIEEPVDSVMITAGQHTMVSTGLRVWINRPGYAGFMFARSGSGSKGLILGNGTGVIDSDYQGDLKMCLYNRTDKPIVVNAGDRVAQMVIMPVFTGYQMIVVDAFSNQTERGTAGFGSTGVQ